MMYGCAQGARCRRWFSVGGGVTGKPRVGDPSVDEVMVDVA